MVELGIEAESPFPLLPIFEDIRKVYKLNDIIMIERKLSSGFMKSIYIISVLALLSFALFGSASYAKIIEPFNATLSNNGSIYLGRVGPGQPFYITAESATTNSSNVIIIRGWNQMYALDLPSGWIVTNSSVYSQTLSVEITPSAKATNGTYMFNILLKNFGNYSKLGTLEFTAYINVTPNVFQLSVSPTNISAAPGAPSNIHITINNTGISDSPFIITAKGLPAWNRTDQVIALHGTSESFVYPIYEYEPGVYTANMSVVSASSSLIHKEANVTMTIKASVENDYKALGYGVVAFPIVYEPIYAVMYFVNLILVHL